MLFGFILDLCRPGRYSKSGVVPCDACPVGKYQPDVGSTDCLSCGVGTTTSATASTSRSACQCKAAYLVYMNTHKRVQAHSHTQTHIVYTCVHVHLGVFSDID